MSRTIPIVRTSVNKKLADELDRIYAAIHSHDPAGPELCWLLSPGVTSDQIQMSWLPASDILIRPDGKVSKNVVRAMRAVASDLLAAARRIEEAGR
jgi:hypothetical protein